MRDKWWGVFFKVTEKSPHEIWRSAGGSDRGERSVKRSMSAPASIWFLMLLVTGGGSRASALGGMGMEMVEASMKGGRAVGRERGRKAVAGAEGEGILTLVSAPGATDV